VRSNAYGHFFGDEFQIEYPTGSGVRMDLTQIAADLRNASSDCSRSGRRRARLLRAGRSTAARLRWFDNITFNEYFHGDNGAGLGATHQTGWTGSWPT
jgi:hypothetical protein